MDERELAGSRIRARRLALGMRQTALAATVAISPAYLNLIEHNRRRIGGRLLMRIADALGVEPRLLSRGAQAELVAAVSEAAEAMPEIAPDPSDAKDFAAASPGWARLVAAQFRRLQEQARAIDALTDRMTHDPQLAASMHEILSVVTAIRSTAGILAGDEEVQGEWLARFQRNLYEDSQRLANSAQALVAYLDEAETGAEGSDFLLPQEAFETWLAGQGHRLDALEGPGAANAEALAAEAAEAHGVSPEMLRPFVVAYRTEAMALPADRLDEAFAAAGGDPLGMARAMNLPFAIVLRRLAWRREEMGLVECDSSGTITLRKPVEGFSIPRFGAGCPLWPLFQALARPLVPQRRRVRQAGYAERDFVAYSVAEPMDGPGYGAAVVARATMLLVPAEGIEHAPAKAEPSTVVGSSCRICPVGDCSYRREPSVLGAEPVG